MDVHVKRSVGASGSLKYVIRGVYVKQAPQSSKPSAANQRSSK